jgi:hypothetical protein
MPRNETDELSQDQMMDAEENVENSNEVRRAYRNIREQMNGEKTSSKKTMS